MPSLASTVLALRVRSHGLGARPPVDLGFWSGYPHAGVQNGGGGASQVPGESRCMHALLSDPGGTSAPGHHGASMLPCVYWTTSAPTTNLISGLNHTAYMLAVYASQPGLPHVHARLASGWWPASTEREWLPAGLQREVSSCCYTSSSSPRLGLAHPIPDAGLRLVLRMHSSFHPEMVLHRPSRGPECRWLPPRG